MTLNEALNNLFKAIDEESKKTLCEYQEAKLEVFNEYEHHRSIYLAGKVAGLELANGMIFKILEDLRRRESK